MGTSETHFAFLQPFPFLSLFSVIKSSQAAHLGSWAREWKAKALRVSPSELRY